MKGDKIPSTHSRAKMDMQYNEPSNAIEKRKQKRQARRENRRYLKEEFKKEDIYTQTKEKIMPKTVWTPRDELVCGKLDRAYEIAIRFESIELLDLLADIRHDCERMEQKLISRKEQVKAMKKQYCKENTK